MSTITAILQADADGTIHLRLPKEFRYAQVEITAKLRAVTDAATAEKVSRRRIALNELRRLGGLREAVPHPAAWQRELRQDRPLPGRD